MHAFNCMGTIRSEEDIGFGNGWLVAVVESLHVHTNQNMNDNHTHRTHL